MFNNDQAIEQSGKWKSQSLHWRVVILNNVFKSSTAPLIEAN